MKIVRRFVSRSRSATVLAIAALLSSLAGAAVFHGAILSWTHGEQNSDFLAAHVAHMRIELARIHHGKVDGRTLARILNAQPVANDSAAADAPDLQALKNGIARYLAGQATSDRTGIIDARFVTFADAGAATAAPGPAAPAADDRTYVGQKT
ncbi:MAG TPA: hypothetical protein VGI20_14190 [Rhizomicrobium sp.]